MEALAHELREGGTSLSAHVLCPGQVDTNMLNGIGADRIDARSEDQRRQAEQRAEVAMKPHEMAALLVDGVNDGKFYLLGYDSQQPLDWLKELNALRSEDIRKERPPLAHLSDHEDASELRQRLRDIRKASRL